MSWMPSTHRLDAAAGARSSNFLRHDGAADLVSIPPDACRRGPRARLPCPAAALGRPVRSGAVPRAVLRPLPTVCDVMLELANAHLCFLCTTQPHRLMNPHVLATDGTANRLQRHEHTLHAGVDAKTVNLS